MAMAPLPNRLYSAAQTRELDRLAIAGGVSGATLMARAGQAAFDLMLQRWPEVREPAILCGAGNNGGDGYVVARWPRKPGCGPWCISGVRWIALAVMPWPWRRRPVMPGCRCSH